MLRYLDIRALSSVITSIEVYIGIGLVSRVEVSSINCQPSGQPMNCLQLSLAWQ